MIWNIWWRNIIRQACEDALCEYFSRNIRPIGVAATSTNQGALRGR